MPVRCSLPPCQFKILSFHPLAALQGVNLVDGENASWGYNITTVDGLTADYDGKSEYWSIYVYDADEDQFVSLETAVDATPIYAYSVFMFMMDNG